MNAAIPSPPPGSSAYRLARLFNRRDCVFLPSPSLALLCVLIAGKSRPARLLVQRTASPFLANVGRISGTPSEFVPDEDGEEFRALLRSIGPSETGVWAVAVHAPTRLTPPEWFAACDSRGVRTVELSQGALFDLARRGPSVATVTIVSLDDEPAFEGVSLTALLTDDQDLAQRVRQLCLPGSESRDFVLDASPRGLVEDEEALRTLIEQAIARDAAASSRGSAVTSAPRKSFSLAWKRVFKSDSPASEDGTPEGGEDPRPPRGKNSWLARMAELERLQAEAVRQAQAETETTRARGAEQVARLQSALDQSERRLEETRSLAEKAAEEMATAVEGARALASAAAAEQNAALTAALGQAEKETVRLRKEVEALQAQGALSNRGHEAALAEWVTRANEAEAERDQAQIQLKSVLAERQRDAALQAVSSATAEKTRLAMVAKTDELEEAVAGARTRIESLEEQAAHLTLLSATATAARETAAAQLLQDATSHQDALRVAEEREAALRRENADETARLNTLVSEWQTRFDAAGRVATKEAQRREAQHLTQIARVQDEVKELRQQAEGAALAQSQSASGYAAKIAQLEKESAVLATERDALLARLAQEQAASAETLTRAHEQSERVQREKSEEAARLTAALSEWQTRFEASAAAAAQETERTEKRHGEAVKKLETELARVKGAVTDWQARFDTAAVAALRETEGAQTRHAEVVRHLEGELARANGALSEWQTRFDHAATTAAMESESTEKRHAEAVTKLETELARVNAAVADGQARFEASATAAAQEAEGTQKRHNEAVKQLESKLVRANTAAQEGEHTGKRLAEVVTRLEGELGRLREQAEAAVQAHERSASEWSERIAGLEREAATLSTERDASELRLAQSEQRLREASQRFDDRFATIERDKAEEISRLSAGLALGQARFDAAALSARDDARAREAEHLERVAGIQGELNQARAESEAKALQVAGEIAAFEKRTAVLEAEKAAVVTERQDLAARLGQAERVNQRAEQVAKGRIAALERAHLKKTSSLSKTVTSWQARFETAARNAAREAQRIELRNLTLVTRLQEKAAQLKKQAGAAIRDQVREAAAFGKRLSVLERERDAAAYERDQGALRLQEMAEETARLTSLVGEWQSRFDATALVAAAESQRREANHSALVERLQAELAKGQSLAEETVAERDRVVASLEERLNQADREKVAALQARDEFQTRARQQEDQHAESLNKSEERFRRIQQEAVEESKRLLGVAIEWQSRFDATVAKHAQDQAELKERLVALEGERVEALKERDALQAHLLQRDEKHTAMVEAMEERARLLHREKAEEAARLSTAAADWQTRFDAAVAKGKQEQAELKERLAALERDRAAALKELDQLRAGSRKAEEKYEAMMRTAEERAKSSQETLAGETARLTAAHNTLVAELREQVAQLSKRSEGPTEAQTAAQTAAVSALTGQLSALKRAKAAAEEERKLIEARLNQAGEAQRQALRRAEAAQEEKAAEVVRLRETIRDWQSRFDAASQAQSASTAALAERLKAMEKEKATANAELERAGERLRQLDEGHRQAMRSAEASRVEAETRLRSAEARLAEVIQTRTAGSEAAEIAAANLRAALETRALESAAHAKALETWDAHRATLEARIAGLEKAQSLPSASLRHQRPVGPARDSDGDEERNETPSQKPALAKDGAAASAHGTPATGSGNGKGAGSSGRPGPKLVPWEYERILKGEREEKRNAVEDWRRSPPPRSSRD